MTMSKYVLEDSRKISSVRVRTVFAKQVLLVSRSVTKNE